MVESIQCFSGQTGEGNLNSGTSKMRTEHQCNAWPCKGYLSKLSLLKLLTSIHFWAEKLT